MWCGGHGGNSDGDHDGDGYAGPQVGRSQDDEPGGGRRDCVRGNDKVMVVKDGGGDRVGRVGGGVVGVVLVGGWWEQLWL